MRSFPLLTEDQIQRRFRQIFASTEINGADLEKAESLIDQLRWESPLRHRLTEELDELRKLCVTEG